MITFFSLVTSAKDYFEIVNKLLEFHPQYSINDYNELGSLISYITLTLKNFITISVTELLNLHWFNYLGNLPIIVPDVSSAMISEISVLDGFFHNAFTFLETPFLYGKQNVSVYGIEKFTIGFLNSFFLFLPTSASHFILLRRFIFQGIEAGYLAGIGIIVGNLFWLTSIIFGWRFFVIPWISLDIFRYLLGFVILIKYMWYTSQDEKRNNIITNFSKFKIILVTFLLALTEQTSIYPFVSNISIGSESSILEMFPVENLTQFFFIHGFYLLGIFSGSLSLLHLTCWIWENPLYKIYRWFTTNSHPMNNVFKGSVKNLYKYLNFIFLYLIMFCTISSIPYFGLDYTITNPLGLIYDDRILYPSSLSTKTIPPLGLFGVLPLNIQASDKNTRDSKGRHGRRERWKERLIKYRGMDTALYDQGIYDLFTIEDLNYGFDKFWLRRKIKNHHSRFRMVIFQPWLLALKKQLAKPRLISNEGVRVELFRMLYEQFYHPNFHAYLKKKNFLSLKDNSFGLAKQPEEKSNFGTTFNPLNQTSKGGFERAPEANEAASLKKNSLDLQLPLLKIDSKFLNTFNKKNQKLILNNFLRYNHATKKKLLIKDISTSNFLFYNPQLYKTNLFKRTKINNNLIKEFSTLRKLVRKINTRIKTSEIFLKNSYFKSILTFPFHLFSDELDLKQIGKLNWNKPIYSKSNNIKNLLLFPSQKNKTIQQILLSLPENAEKNVKNPLNDFRFAWKKKINKKTTFLNNFFIFLKKKKDRNNQLERLEIKSRIKEKLSKKDRKILRYRTSLQFNKNEKLFLPPAVKKTAKNHNFLNITNNATTLLHPIKFYLQKDKAFKRKLNFYGTNIYRKLSIENNAPYFRTMMKRLFYFYKPTLRWTNTLKLAKNKQGHKIRRKKYRKPLTILFNVDTVTNNKSISPRGNENSLVLDKIQPQFTSPLMINTNQLWNTQEKKINNFSFPLTKKPTHNFRVIGKNASRYRFQIYKDVLHHWYYTPFNRFLLKFDVDFFIRRQPYSHFLTKKEENELHLKRFLLAEYYETLRWYTYMQHYRSMKTKIGGTKSFASRMYNHQFQGTLKKIRHLFAITPERNWLSETVVPVSNNYLKTKTFESEKSPFNLNTLSSQRIAEQDNSLIENIKKNMDKLIKNNLDYTENTESFILPNKKSMVLTFDQPLYNEYKNFSAATQAPGVASHGKEEENTKNLLSPTVTHEELLTSHKNSHNSNLDNLFFDYFLSSLRSKTENLTSLLNSNNNNVFAQQETKQNNQNSMLVKNSLFASHLAKQVPDPYLLHTDGVASFSSGDLKKDEKQIYKKNKKTKNVLDLIAQSKLIIREYLKKAYPIRQAVFEKLLIKKQYKELTNFILNGQKTRSLQPITNQSSLLNQEKKFLGSSYFEEVKHFSPIFSSSKFDESKNKIIINQVKKNLSTSSFNNKIVKKNIVNNRIEKRNYLFSQLPMWFFLLHNYKKGFYDQEFQPKFLDRRIKKREKRFQKKNKELTNRLKRVQNWLAPTMSYLKLMNSSLNNEKKKFLLSDFPGVPRSSVEGKKKEKKSNFVFVPSLLRTMKKKNNVLMSYAYPTYEEETKILVNQTTGIKNAIKESFFNLDLLHNQSHYNASLTSINLKKKIYKKIFSTQKNNNYTTVNNSLKSLLFILKKISFFPYGKKGIAAPLPGLQQKKNNLIKKNRMSLSKNKIQSSFLLPLQRKQTLIKIKFFLKTKLQKIKKFLLPWNWRIYFFGRVSQGENKIFFNNNKKSTSTFAPEKVKKLNFFHFIISPIRAKILKDPYWWDIKDKMLKKRKRSRKKYTKEIKKALTTLLGEIKESKKTFISLKKSKKNFFTKKAKKINKELFSDAFLLFSNNDNFPVAKKMQNINKQGFSVLEFQKFNLLLKSQNLQHLSALIPSLGEKQKKKNLYFSFSVKEGKKNFLKSQELQNEYPTSFKKFPLAKKFISKIKRKKKSSLFFYGIQDKNNNTIKKTPPSGEIQNFLFSKETKKTGNKFLYLSLFSKKDENKTKILNFQPSFKRKKSKNRRNQRFGRLQHRVEHPSLNIFLERKSANMIPEKRVKMLHNVISHFGTFSRTKLNQTQRNFKLTSIKKRKSKKRNWKKYKKGINSEKIRKAQKQNRDLMAIQRVSALTKQIKRMRLRLKLQQWWWQQFLPNIQTTTDATWKLERERQLQKTLSKLSKTEMLERDLINTKNIVFPFGKNQENKIKQELQIGNYDFKPLSIPQSLRIRENLTKLNILNFQNKNFSTSSLSSQSTMQISPEVIQNLKKKNLLNTNKKLSLIFGFKKKDNIRLILFFSKQNKFIFIQNNLFRVVSQEKKESDVPFFQPNIKNNFWNNFFKGNTSTVFLKQLYNNLFSVSFSKTQFHPVSPPRGLDFKFSNPFILGKCYFNLLIKKKNFLTKKQNLKKNSMLKSFFSVRSKNPLQGATSLQNSFGDQKQFFPFFPPGKTEGGDEIKKKSNSFNLDTSKSLPFVNLAFLEKNEVKSDTLISKIPFLPFYAGWDESLRKFVVTNRLLSRREANYSATLVNNSLGTKIQFSNVPLQGMNAGTTLYCQVPFTTFDPDQLFSKGMDGFAPIGWRRFNFTHIILQKKTREWRNFFVTSFIEKTKINQHQLINPLKITEISLNFDFSKYNFIAPSFFVGPPSLASSFASQWKETTQNKKKNERTTYNVVYKLQKKAFVKIKKLFSSSSPPTCGQGVCWDGKEHKTYSNYSRRFKKHYKRIKKLQFEKVPVLLISGPLIHEVLPIHYINVFNKQNRLSRDRYIKRRFRKGKKGVPKAIQEFNYQNQEKFNSFFKYPIENKTLKTKTLLIKSFIVPPGGGEEKKTEFTLRRRIKTKRKYHRKPIPIKGNKILPYRHKFIIKSNYLNINNLLISSPSLWLLPRLSPLRGEVENGKQKENLSTAIRKRPSKRSLKNKKNESLPPRRGGRDSNQEDKNKYGKAKKKAKSVKKGTFNARLRQLRRRVFRQIIKPIPRRRPRAGGFIWPGDYLRLEQTPSPKLLYSSSLSSSLLPLKKNENLNKQKIRRKIDKKALLLDLYVQPRKSLLRHHNIKILRKKLEKTHRINILGLKQNLAGSQF